MNYEISKQKDAEAVFAIAELEQFHQAWAEKHRHIIEAVQYGPPSLPKIASVSFGEIVFKNLIVLNSLMDIEFKVEDWELKYSIGYTEPNK